MRGQQLTGAHAEEDGRHPEIGDALEDGPGGGKREAGVLVWRQRTGPAVEELHGLGAGPDLRPKRGDGHGGQALGQLGPECGVAVHQRLDLGERARRPAFDQIAGHREGCAGEADERDAAAGQFAADQLHRGRHVGGVGLGLEGPQAAQVARVAEGLGHDRATAGLDGDAETDGVQRDHDVGEQDRGVDAVAADRLQRELGRERRILDGREDRSRRPGRPGTREGLGPPGA